VVNTRGPRRQRVRRHRRLTPRPDRREEKEILADGHTSDPTVIDDVGWFYTDPYEPVAAIAGNVAFHPERVKVTDHAATGEPDVVWTDRSREGLDAYHG
jgi:hypothetical protein